MIHFLKCSYHFTLAVVLTTSHVYPIHVCSDAVGLVINGDGGGGGPHDLAACTGVGYDAGKVEGLSSSAGLFQQF